MELLVAGFAWILKAYTDSKSDWTNLYYKKKHWKELPTKKLPLVQEVLVVQISLGKYSGYTAQLVFTFFLRKFVLPITEIGERDFCFSSELEMEM